MKKKNLHTTYFYMKKYKEVESHVLKNGRVKRPAVDSDAAFVFLAFATGILPAM